MTTEGHNHEGPASSITLLLLNTSLIFLKSLTASGAHPPAPIEWMNPVPGRAGSEEPFRGDASQLNVDTIASHTCTASSRTTTRLPPGNRNPAVGAVPLLQAFVSRDESHLPQFARVLIKWASEGLYGGACPSQTFSTRTTLAKNVVSLPWVERAVQRRMMTRGSLYTIGQLSHLVPNLTSVFLHADVKTSSLLWTGLTLNSDGARVGTETCSWERSSQAQPTCSG